MGKHHELKIWPEHYEAVKSGRMTFQMRRNDRDFKKGDTVCLNEFCPKTNGYLSTKPLFFEVGDVHHVSIEGIVLLVAFSLLPIKAAQPAPTPKPSAREIAGRLLFEASGGAFNDSGSFRRWENWVECDRKALFMEAGEKFAKDLARASLAALEEGGAA